MDWIPNIIEDVLLNRISYEADVLSADYNAPNSTVTLHDIKHLRPDLIVTFSSVPYGVISVDHSANTFVVAGDVSAETTVTLPKPRFFHGTQRAVNREIQRNGDEAMTPFVWLLEPLGRSGSSDDGDGNPAYQNANVRLFFLDGANYADWDTDDYYLEAHTPMGRLAEWFYWFVDFNLPRGIRTAGSFTLTAYGPFGTSGERGSLESIFNERCAGIELVADFLFIDCAPNKALNTESTPIQAQSQGLQYPLQFGLG